MVIFFCCSCAETIFILLCEFFFLFRLWFWPLWKCPWMNGRKFYQLADSTLQGMSAVSSQGYLSSHVTIPVFGFVCFCFYNFFCFVRFVSFCFVLFLYLLLLYLGSEASSAQIVILLYSALLIARVGSVDWLYSHTCSLPSIVLLHAHAQFHYFRYFSNSSSRSRASGMTPTQCPWRRTSATTTR